MLQRFDGLQPFYDVLIFYSLRPFYYFCLRSSTILLSATMMIKTLPPDILVRHFCDDLNYDEEKENFALFGLKPPVVFGCSEFFH